MGTTTQHSTTTTPAADAHDLIRVSGARENNLKNVSVDLPKRRLTVFTGVSGSGKSSLVFDTIAAESQRMINETYSRSEEHTSELQSRGHLVCRLLLEKKQATW